MRPTAERWWRPIVSATVMPSVKKRAIVSRVQPLDVIAFQERVHDQLPVRRHVVDPAPVEMVAGQPERVEFGRQRIGVGEIRVLVAREPDQAARLARRQFAQVMIGLVEAGKGVGPRHAGKRAVERIGPGVIGADDARRCTTSRRPRSAACRDGGRRCRRHARRPALSRVSSSGMPNPSCATAMFGSGSSAEGAITCGSAIEQLRLLARRSGPRSV